MAKKSAKSKSKKKSNKRAVQNTGQGFGARSLSTELRMAEARLAKEHWEEAFDILKPLGQRFPEEKRVWEYLTHVSVKLGKLSTFVLACERWLTLEPKNGKLYYSLGFSYLSLGHLSLALDAFRKAMGCELTSDQKDAIKKELPELEEAAAAAKAAFPQGTEAWWDVLLLSETAEVKLMANAYEDAREAIDELLEIVADYPPALNSLSALYWSQDQPKAAIAQSKDVLSADAENIPALADLVKYHVLLGEDKAAEEYGQQLRSHTAKNSDVRGWTRQAEGLSYLCDDEGLVTLHEQWQSVETADSTAKASAQFCHLLAVGLARSDRAKDARARWKQSLDISDRFRLASDNLNTLVYPIGQQPGPWPFPFSHWLIPAAYRQLTEILSAYRKTTRIDKMQSMLESLVEDFPTVLKIMPRVLERGSPEGQNFYVLLTDHFQDESYVSTMKAFVTGRNGTDFMRLQAAMSLAQFGGLSEDSLMMWQDGEQRDIVLKNYDLHEEPLFVHSKEVETLLAQAIDLLYEETVPAALKAEPILQKTIELEPDAPDLLNNLSACYMSSNREDKAIALLKDIHERFPDYLFSNVALAQHYTDESRYDEADELLLPLLKRDRLHFGEFEMLMTTKIKLEMARQDWAAARMWLAIWDNLVPDYPRVAELRAAIIRESKSGLMPSR